MPKKTSFLHKGAVPAEGVAIFQDDHGGGVGPERPSEAIVGSRTICIVITKVLESLSPAET